MTTAPPQVRLDERAMVAGTTTRFVLLVVLMLVSSSSMLPLALTGAGLNKGAQCLLAAGGASNEAPSAEISRSAAYRACIAHHVLLPGWVSPVVPVILLVLAGGLFFALPVWKTRRNRVIPLAAVDHDGRILRQLEQLAGVAGLERVPRVVVDPCAASTGAVVFGRNRRPTVCLHGGLLVRRTTAPKDFEAVLLHELAHIRNGDVTLTYATVSLWRMFIAAVLVPYAVGFGILVFTPFAQDPPPYQVGLPAWRALVLPLLMAVVVYLARSDVLRNRELHADLAAARWGADPHIWGVVAPAPPARVLTRALRSFTELWRTHPRWDLRREALADSAALFEVPALPVFLTGTTAVLINGQLWQLNLSGVGQWTWDLAMALAPAGLITGVVGVALWRAVVHGLLTTRRGLSGARAGLWLGVGMTVGELFVNRIAIYRWLPGEPVIVMLVVLAGMAFAWWVAQCAHLWATVWRGRTLHPPMVLVLAGACLALCAWFWWWQDYGVILANERGLLANPFGPGSEGLLVDPTGEYTATLAVTVVAVSQLATTVAVPLSLPAVAVLWVVPLMAWAVRRLPMGWVRRAIPGIDESALPSKPLPPLRRAILAGLLGGVMCWVAVASVKAYMHSWQPPVRLRGISAAILFQDWVSAAILGGAAVAALLASLLANRYQLIAALVAAHTAVLAGYSGMLVLSASDGCIQALSTFTAACDWQPGAIWQAFQYLLSILLVLATIVAIASAAATSVVRKVLRGWPHLVISAPAGKEPRGLVVRRLVVGVLCAGAIGIPAAELILPLPQGNGEDSQSPKPSANPIFAAQVASEQVKLAEIHHDGREGQSGLPERVGPKRQQ
jgi:Zn-dependent protease with chaperone function